MGIRPIGLIMNGVTGRMGMNQPSSVVLRVAGVLCGSARVQVCHSLARCFSAVPWNQVGVGESITQGW